MAEALIGLLAMMLLAFVRIPIALSMGIDVEKTIVLTGPWTVRVRSSAPVRTSQRITFPSSLDARAR